MNTLFPDQPLLPDGFSYQPDFLSLEEETELCKAIYLLDLHPMIFQGFEAKRKVQSFGYDYSFDRRSLSKGQDIPDEFNWLVEKVSAKLGIAAEEFAELLVTEYPPGAVINWHRDAPPFDIVAGISLMTDCSFRLRPYDKSLQGRQSIISLLVQKRSLYLLSGASRSEWEHSIAPVKQKRYSVTLRTLRHSGN
jgi:alkylated DNA repair dioxygenase AlkB